MTIVLILLLASPALRAQFVIMPLGDSITWGYNGSLTNPATPGGYRSYLYSDLVADGHSVSYVGVNTDNPSSLLTTTGQTGHNGFNGYKINEIDGNLNGVLATPPIDNYGGYWLTGGHGTGRGPESANVILLHIGTNDINQGYDPTYNPGNPFNTAGESAALFATHMTLRLETLIDDLMLYEPNATLLVAGILPIAGAANTKVQLYNAGIQTLLTTTYGGENIHYVDMYSPFVTGSNAQNSSLFTDGVHPTTAGYDLMAQTWADAIELNVTIAVPEPSTWLLVAMGGLGLFRVSRRRAGC